MRCHAPRLFPFLPPSSFRLHPCPSSFRLPPSSLPFILTPLASRSKPGLPCDPQFAQRGEGGALLEDFAAAGVYLIQDGPVDRCHYQTRTLGLAVLARQIGEGAPVEVPGTIDLEFNQ